MALAFTMPSSTVYSGWWWISVLSNDPGRCAVVLSVSVGCAGGAHSHRVPPLVRARRRRSFPSETWKTQGFLFGTPLVLARALASDAAELQWPGQVVVALFGNLEMLCRTGHCAPLRTRPASFRISS